MLITMIHCSDEKSYVINSYCSNTKVSVRLEISRMSQIIDNHSLCINAIKGEKR